MFKSNGVDIVKISRIENILTKKKDKFINRVFTDKETEYINNRNNSPQTISGIFAAKEAISKVLGTGIGKISWKDIEVIHDVKGKPYVKLYNDGLRICNKLGINRIALSISHEKEYAVAFAIGIGNRDKENIIVPGNIQGILTKRNKNSHKGTFGRVGIIAGSIGMTGAPYLATMAAFRSGSGLVYTIIPKGISKILSIKLIEAIIKPVEDDNTGNFTLNSAKEINEIIQDMDVLALGPGIGIDHKRIELIKKILLSYKGPIVLDADGINCISLIEPDILLNRKGPTIITPHPKELSRLVGVSTNEIQKKRLEYSKYVCNKYNIITVLKGADTIVGDGRENIYINSTGNPGMATAGSGDILTGMIASFIGQGIEPYNAAVLGVYCHGLAGDLAKKDKGEYGMIARDILDNIPYSIKKLEV
jgi:holo-[acyl-carrier-protein] synthase